MADKTPAQLTAITTPANTDLLVVYDVAATLLKKITWANFLTRVIAGLGASYLTVANNLSDLASASTARANLGLGTAATLASSALFQVANNFSEVANAATARSNIGAAASNGPTITGGMTFTGQTKQNVQAVSGTAIDVSVSEIQTKAISADTTFTFTNATASVGQGFLLKLTVSSSAVPTWPASVKWDTGTAPSLNNGIQWLAFLTDDGGTTWYGTVFGQDFA